MERKKASCIENIQISTLTFQGKVTIKIEKLYMNTVENEMKLISNMLWMQYCSSHKQALAMICPDPQNIQK